MWEGSPESPTLLGAEQSRDASGASLQNILAGRDPRDTHLSVERRKWGDGKWCLYEGHLCRWSWRESAQKQKEKWGKERKRRANQSNSSRRRRPSPAGGSLLTGTRPRSLIPALTPCVLLMLAPRMSMAAPGCPLNAWLCVPSKPSKPCSVFLY